MSKVVSKVVFDITMSLDGFITAANQTADAPMGDDGERLHQWAFDGDERDQAVMNDGLNSLGAVVCGRRTYETSVPWWGADGPSGSVRAPVFVLSQGGPPDDVPEGGVYEFVADAEAAVEKASAVAGDKVVTVMGGAETGRRLIEAGLVDEFSIHLVPVIFGAGTSMFGGMPSEHLELESIETRQTGNATHLRYRVRK